MSDLSTKVCTVIDNGIFVDIALTIAPAFKQCFYWSPWQSAFPSSSKLLPGDGFDEIERVRWLWDAIHKSDLVVFPDVYFGDLQVHLDALEMPVWGARRGEMLELDRVKTKQILKKLGEPVGPYAVVTGIDDLRSYLKDHPNVWCKLSSNRGDAETFKCENYDLIEPRLDEIEWRLGAKATIAEFVVEDDISPAVEFGFDGFVVDGYWPERSFFGIERKDEGFIGKVIEYSDFPDVLKRSNTALSQYFERKRYRGFYSSELRVTDKDTAYAIDPCCRAASPPHEIYMEIFDNWPDIMMAGAKGELVAPNQTAKYGVCAMIHSPWASKNWLPLKIPNDIKRFVKLRNHCRIDGVDFFVPQPDSDLPEIGAVIGLGNTLDEAKNQLHANADQIKGYDLDIKLSCLDEADEDIEEAKKFGIEI